MPTLRDVVAALDARYDPRWAAEWDAVGTVVGDPESDITKILFAVDPVQAVVDEALDWGADLLVTHHPLFLRGVTTVAASTPKGRIVHELIRGGVALLTCHTNADSPARGVSESMALALGIVDPTPLESEPAGDRHDLWILYVPEDDANRVAEAMHDAGAGAIGDYDRAMFSHVGTGQFRPLEGADPAIGEIGAVESVQERRLEMVAPPGLREAVRAAMLAAHPYEEVAYSVIAAEPRPPERSNARGSGRIGTLAEPTTLGAFADAVAAALPAHHSATRVAGDLSQPVRTVAVCGGSGDFLLATAQAAGADVYVTSDLRHHPVSEHRENPGACGVIDVPHWAAEWTWLPVAAADVAQSLGATVETRVSTVVTDPWTHVLTSRGANAER
jgi:dinuclear metal center YbgI/SA1388 family protein